MNGPYIKQVVVLDSAWCSKPKCAGVQLCCDLVNKMGRTFMSDFANICYFKLSPKFTASINNFCRE